MKAQNLNRMTPYVFMAPAAIIMGLALLYPLAYMISGLSRAWDPSQNISETEFVGLKTISRYSLTLPFGKACLSP